ncbi:MAG TPA: hypothetical protein VNZ61_15685 [Roseomonas sp.]|nr:hypothetical protein [Roseomonas sp.]
MQDSYGSRLVLHLLAFTALILPLAGCGLQDALDAMDRERFEKACAHLGIAKGSPSWDQCMIQQQASDREEEQRSLDRMQQREMMEKWKRGR